MEIPHRHICNTSVEGNRSKVVSEDERPIGYCANSLSWRRRATLAGKTIIKIMAACIF